MALVSIRCLDLLLGVLLFLHQIVNGVDGESKEPYETTGRPNLTASTRRRHGRHSQPNIVLILTDDLDWTLGGANASTLAQTRRLIADEGKTFANWFVQTPVCCPSRAELLTGRYFHNIRTTAYDDETTSTADTDTATRHQCMHVDVDGSDACHPFWSQYYFARYFAALNFTVGVFGKHLNNENPRDFMLPGVDEMLMNGGGNYLDPSFTHGRRFSNETFDVREVSFDNCHATTGMPCYSTSVIGNASLDWIQKQHETKEGSPFFALISVKAPHIQDADTDFPKAVPAPWYQRMTLPTDERRAPRIPNYNFSATDHHWLVRTQPPFSDVEADNVDDLHVSRLKTLQSVDDLVVDLVDTLRSLKILDHTYIVFTSDNGYRLGQFQMPQLKLHPYENDVRVPMMIRGPGIRRRAGDTVVDHVMASHVDLMPTLWGLAQSQRRRRRRRRRQQRQQPNDDEDQNNNIGSGGCSYHHPAVALSPPTMDGADLTASILDEEDHEHHVPQVSLLIEYMSLGNVIRYRHLVDTYNHTFMALRILLPEKLGSVGHELLHCNDFPNFGESNATHQLFNFKYVEFRDCRSDWNSSLPPLEVELYDLERDPFELRNLLSDEIQHGISPMFRQALSRKMERMFHCQGETCRKEQGTGLVETWKTTE